MEPRWIAKRLPGWLGLPRQQVTYLAPQSLREAAETLGDFPVHSLPRNSLRDEAAVVCVADPQHQLLQKVPAVPMGSLVQGGVNAATAVSQGTTVHSEWLGVPAVAPGPNAGPCEG